MSNQEIIEKAELLSAQHAKHRTDARTTRVLGFLKSKGLLLVDWVVERPSIKFDVVDALWVAEKVEPRVLELLPAVLLHFPRTVINLEKLPQELSEVIKALKAQAAIGPSYHEIPFEKFRKWAEFRPKDKRVVPLSDKKIMRSFRLKRQIAAKLSALAKAQDISEGDLIEQLLLRPI